MWSLLLGLAAVASLGAACTPSVTKVSGTYAPAVVCSGELIFADQFDDGFDLERWQHENTLAGGGNWEFQYYNNNRTNSFVENGILYIRPSLTSEQFSNGFLSTGTLNIEGGAPADRCTNPKWYGCERVGTPDNVINPIKSARIRTVESFSFRYGRLEVRAKMPAGDWLWPAIWLMPAYNVYGTWPASGEIDLVESRGNRNMYQNGDHIGVQEAGSTLHYGPYPELNGWERAHWLKRDSSGYDTAFHRYQLEWTPDYLKFSIDDQEFGRIAPPAGGFWEHAGFNQHNVENPWRYGSKMAPFDQKVLEERWTTLLLERGGRCVARRTSTMWSLFFGLAVLTSLGAACVPSVTTVSGTHAPIAFCPGDLIFADEFDEFSLEIWQHEKTLAGDRAEFQFYDNNRTNSFAHDGVLYIRPSLTSDQLGENFLWSDTLNLDGSDPADSCTYGCERTGTRDDVLNPVKSARIRTINSFSFRYGILEVRAKMPAGDWLFPAIWLIPTFASYGPWPVSGEMDLVESRGNKDLVQNGVNIGTQEVAASLHFAPYRGLDAWRTAHWVGRNSSGYDADFHRYQLEWTPDYIKFSLDDEELGTMTPPDGGFWEHGGFASHNAENPWRYAPHTKMAPFDQKFYIIMNIAVGGTSGYFPDNAVNPVPKPWKNWSPRAMSEFWEGRDGWLPTWNLDVNDGADASLQVDYVRVWAL